MAQPIKYTYSFRDKDGEEDTKWIRPSYKDPETGKVKYEPLIKNIFDLKTASQVASLKPWQAEMMEMATMEDKPGGGSTLRPGVLAQYARSKGFTGKPDQASQFLLGMVKKDGTPNKSWGSKMDGAQGGFDKIFGGGTFQDAAINDLKSRGLQDDFMKGFVKSSSSDFNMGDALAALWAAGAGGMAAAGASAGAGGFTGGASGAGVSGGVGGGLSGGAGAGLGAGEVAGSLSGGLGGGLAGESVWSGGLDGGFTGGASGGGLSGVETLAEGALTGGAGGGGTTVGGVGGALSGAEGALVPGLEGAGSTIIDGAGNLVDAAGNIIGPGVGGGTSTGTIPDLPPTPPTGPGSGTELPPDVPVEPVEPELPVDPEVPPVDPEVPPVDPELPPIDPEVPPIDEPTIPDNVPQEFEWPEFEWPEFEWPELPDMGGMNMDWLQPLLKSFTDNSNLWSAGLQGLLGYLGSDAKGDALRDIYNDQKAVGQPYRDKLLESYQPGFNLMDQPGYGDAFNRMGDIAARSAGVKGNPGTTPSLQGDIMKNVWEQGFLPAQSNYRGGLMQAGGMGLNTSAVAGMAGADFANPWLTGLGSAAGSLFGNATNPQQKQDPTKLTIGGNVWGN